jgi:tyrosinase
MLTKSLLGGLVVFAGMPSGLRAATQAPAQMLRIRKEIHGLALNHPDVETLRDGVGMLKKASAPGLTTIWESFAAIHGNANGFNKCPHGNWYFLPWHRAYLLMYENFIRVITKNTDFALPYWDWSKNRTVPKAFSDPMYKGDDNPLYVVKRNNRFTAGDELVGKKIMDEIYAQSDFELFASSRAEGQSDTDTGSEWIKRSGKQGPLEYTPHNHIHNDLDGFMPDGHSPLDPIFLMHHGNIDRIWRQWSSLHPSTGHPPSWLKMQFYNHFYHPTGSFKLDTPEMLLDTSALGYSYDAQFESVPQPAIRTLANDRLSAIFQAGSAAQANAPGSQQVPMQSNVNGAVLESLGRTAPESISNTFNNLDRPSLTALNIDAAGSTSQIVALIYNLTPPDNQTEVLVFAGMGDIAPTATETTSPYFVQPIGFFGIHAHGHNGISVTVDLTEHLRKQATQSDQIRVWLVARTKGSGSSSVPTAIAHAEVEIVLV